MSIRHPKAVPSLPPKKKMSAVCLSKISEAQQARLDDLMGRNNNGGLTDDEKRELTVLVNEAEALTLANARALARYHQHEQERT